MIRELLAEINYERFIHYLNGFSNGFWISFIAAIKNKRWIYHLLGFALAIPFIFLVDWPYFRFMQQNFWYPILFLPAVMLGSFVPVFAPPLLYLYGKKHDIPELIPFAFNLTRTGLLALFWSSLYKAIFGRKGADLREVISTDYSLDFHFGFLYRGVFEGFPSGHTMIAIAMSIYFIRYFDSMDTTSFPPWLAKARTYALIYALYVAYGITTNIHWFADAVASIPIGYAIGIGAFEVKNEVDKLEPDMNKVYRVFSIIFMIVVFSIITIECLVTVCE